MENILINLHQKYLKLYFLTWLGKTNINIINRRFLLIRDKHQNNFIDNNKSILTSWFTNLNTIMTLYIMNLFSIYTLFLTTIIDHPLTYLCIGYIIDWYLPIYSKINHLNDFLITNNINVNNLETLKRNTSFILNCNKVGDKIHTLYNKKKILYLVKQ